MSYFECKNDTATIFMRYQDKLHQQKNQRDTIMEYRKLPNVSKNKQFSALGFALAEDTLEFNSSIFMVQAIISPGKSYVVPKGGGAMKNQQIKIHCVYQNSQKTIGELIIESFHLYLKRILAK